MWRCKGQRYHDGLWPLAEHHMSQTITWYESVPGPLFWLQSSPAGSVGDLRLSAVEVGAQCQVYLRMWREAVVIGCWESLCGAALRLLGLCLMCIFPTVFCLLWFCLRQSGEDLWRTQCAELVYMVATCGYMSTAVYSCQCVCLCVFCLYFPESQPKGVW